MYTIKKLDKQDITAITELGIPSKFDIDISGMVAVFVAYHNYVCNPIEDYNKIVAIGCLANYNGYYYLRGAEVAPKHRGNKLQKSLIDIRLDYLRNNTSAKYVSVWVRPNNCYSLNNLVDCEFRFVDCKRKRFNKKWHIKLIKGI